MEPDREDHCCAPPCAANHCAANHSAASPCAAGPCAAGPSAPPWAAEPGLAGLREAWRQRSLASGWLAADDWHSEAVNAVVAATYGTGPGTGAGTGTGTGAGTGTGTGAGTGKLTLACARLGRSRAKAGIGIAETIDDLAALFAVLGGEQGEPAEPRGPDRRGSDPPLHLVCSIAEGWAEEGLAQLSVGGCEDPLSGLATVPYLRTRLAEVYREAAYRGTSPAETHRLLVIGLPRRPDPWRRMALAIVVGHDLRTAFPGGETLSLARPGPAIALVRARGDLPMRYARLRRTIQATFGAQIRMTRLPGLLTEALRLVDDCLLDEYAR
jgi:hypothetical protein